MRKFIFALFLLFGSTAHAATYYMATTGSNSNDGSEGSPWLTLQYSFSQLSKGDTLIIEDGTYTGDNNRLMSAASPPNGSAWTAGNYTTIKARNDGGVVFDGQGARNMFYHWGAGSSLENCYWQFEGILWCKSYDSSTVFMAYTGQVKFLRCGAYDAPNGNNMTIAVGTGCDYILFENCYAYGSGRYKFSSYQSDHIIFRSCVARMDWVDASAEPMAGIVAAYNGDDCLVQNCIVIDSDQPASYTDSGRFGSFYVVANGADSNRITFVNCVGLNNDIGGISTDGNSSDQANDVTFTNCVLWNCQPASGEAANILRGYNTVVNHCTFGDAVHNYYYLNSYDGIGSDNNTNVTNSIIYAITGGTVFYDMESYSYLDLYGNDNGPSPIGTGSVTTNPLTNSLLYITRIENGSALAGAGSSGSDIGANIKTLIGTSGTLYGETGYNTDTGVSMWPFPNETLIRAKMKAYSGGGVSGDRGFCADGETLTHYIMNYLGNGNPYGDTTAAPKLSGSVRVSSNGAVR